MSATYSEFTLSASATIQADYMPTPIALPSADPANPAFVVSNAGRGAIAIAASGTAPGGTIFGASGAVIIQAGSAKLLTGYATVSVATVQATAPLRATVTVMRGTLADTWLFPNDEVSL